MGDMEGEGRRETGREGVKGALQPRHIGVTRHSLRSTLACLLQHGS